ncbi:universal stress protein [Caballeronia sp. INML2]|uniref:universal stress protein n=1 Tax=Caballeronia sp. INML2 TaxID=2921748 RepID=UPI0020285ECB|nr:universal stress protein [Caballeronia sp. INML2]
MQQHEHTPRHRGGFGRILLCVDFSEAAGSAGAIVRRLARPSSEVTIVAVTPDLERLASHAALAGVGLDVARTRSLAEAQRIVEMASSTFANSTLAVSTQVIDLETERGDVAHALTRVAQERRIDLLIVVMRQHHGLVRWFDPSVLDRLGRLTPCAMVVVPAGYENSQSDVQRILFAIDGSPSSFAALGTGAMLATANTEVRIVYVVDRAICDGDFAPKALLEDAFVNEGERAITAAVDRLQILQTVAPSQVSAHLVSTEVSDDDVSSALLREAKRWDADLMIMGTHGRRGGARSYLGSVPNRVASLAEIRLVLVRESHDGPR